MIGEDGDTGADPAVSRRADFEKAAVPAVPSGAVAEAAHEAAHLAAQPPEEMPEGFVPI